MLELLKELEQLLNEKDLNLPKIQDLKTEILRNHIKGLKIEGYRGDYPTFMEPVILGDKVKIGDDVLIGPRVYIGNDSEIEDYTEISNSIIFDKVRIGSNFKLDNCIILKDTHFNFDNLSKNNCILKGVAKSEEDMEIISF